MLDNGSDALGLAGRKRMEVADLHNLFLKGGKHWLGEGVKPVALEIVKKRDAELLLVRALDEPEIRLQGLPLVRLEIVEQVGLNRRGESEG